MTKLWVSLQAVALLLIGADASAASRFERLDDVLPAPNALRTASGAPGPAYWQQRVDYDIDAELDEVHRTITGRESITYTNHSPDPLSYLWLQLDQNYFATDSDARLLAHAPDFSKLTYQQLQARFYEESYSSDLQITSVKDSGGAPLPTTVVKTVMRVDLAKPLQPGAKLRFSVAWTYRINVAKGATGVGYSRTGYEMFADGHAVFAIAQWYPRLAAYTDATGWQHRPYDGTEFSLESGSFRVRLTVPADHIVAATGELQNPGDVLTPLQRSRLDAARASSRPVAVVTKDEATANTAEAAAAKTKTWVFAADRVRDFAFSSSRKFMWQAMGVRLEDRDSPVMAMSFYPPETEPLWGRFATQAVAHTLEIYSQHTFAYPYPVAIAAFGVGAMEYPMICFLGSRGESDGTYSKDAKYNFISLVIHEVGHNYFPMIVNSDERLFGWMDEGLNSFLQTLAEQQWEQDYPSHFGGEPANIAAYLASDRNLPIMGPRSSFDTNYRKPATALNVLRETVLGRERFDMAFRTFARRWAFKRPFPADFFRTMEDASGAHLDWFWRGWFYSADYVDVAIAAVHRYTLDTQNPAIEKPKAQQERADRPLTQMQQRNRSLPKRLDSHPELRDFYSTYDEAAVRPADEKAYQSLLEGLRRNGIDPALLQTSRLFYTVDLENRGKLITPVILKVDYVDGSTEEIRIPAEAWLENESKLTQFLFARSEIESIQLDPHAETADADVDNNFWPARPIEQRFRLIDTHRPPNPMQDSSSPAKQGNSP